MECDTKGLYVPTVEQVEDENPFPFHYLDEAEGEEDEDKDDACTDEDDAGYYDAYVP